MNGKGGVKLIGLAVVLVMAAGCSSARQGQAVPRAEEEPPPDMTTHLVGTPERAGYPADWKVASADQAAARADFQVIIPSFGPATPEKLQDAWVYPSGPIALDYEAPVKRPESYVRQEYIEVFEAPWLSTESAEEVYLHDLETDPDPSKSIVEIAGIPALVVEAHSKKDLESANPAFVRFEVNGIEVQLSGGEDLDLLLSLAGSMLQQARGGEG